MAGRLADNIAVVTGAARGIGRAIAERLATEGARVACLDVSACRIEAACVEMRAAGHDVHPYVLDVANRNDVHAIMRRIEADLSGPVTTLVNNAVWASYQPIEEIDEVSLEKILAVGLKGIIWTTQAVVPQMKARGAGSIINLSSAAAVQAFSNSAAYCALKAGVAGLTRAAAVELGPFGIRVNAIAPGMIATPASIGYFDETTLETRARSIPVGRFGEPQEIAALAAFLASSDSSYINGALMMADGGSTVVGV